MEESTFLKKLVEYDYEKSPAFIKMQNIVKKISKKEKVGFYKEETKVFRKIIIEENKEKEKKFKKDIELEDEYEKLKQILSSEDKREKDLIELNNKKSLEIIERELEFEKVLLYKNEKKKKFSVLKDSKELNNLKNLKKQINENINKMKRKLGDNIIKKELNIIEYYNEQIKELRQMFEKEFKLQIEKYFKKR